MKVWELWDFEPHKRIFYDHAGALEEAEKCASRAIIPREHRAEAVKQYTREFENKWFMTETQWSMELKS